MSAHRQTIFLLFILIFIILAGGLGFWKFLPKKVEEMKVERQLEFTPSGPYFLLYPRNDGNALIFVLRRIANFQNYAYQLLYQSEGIDRGTGDLNTLISIKPDQSEIRQEVLFGTCSKGATNDPRHCVFDKNVELGSLTFHFYQIEDKKDWLKSSRIIQILKTQERWRLQNVAMAQGKLTSEDQSFSYTFSGSEDEFHLIGYVVVHQLSSVPKLPTEKKIMGKVYAINPPEGKSLPAGEIRIRIEASGEGKIWHYQDSGNWQELETVKEDNFLKAKAPEGGIFAVLE